MGAMPRVSKLFEVLGSESAKFANVYHGLDFRGSKPIGSVAQLVRFARFNRAGVGIGSLGGWSGLRAGFLGSSAIWWFVGVGTVLRGFVSSRRRRRIAGLGHFVGGIAAAHFNAAPRQEKV